MKVFQTMAIVSLIQVAYENGERETVFARAKQAALKSGKPLLNAGCGALRPIGGYPEAIYQSDVNIDIAWRDVPNFTQASIESIPYPDKYFGAAFCCHTLEHVDNYQAALTELGRVADEVFIITPAPVWASTWLNPGHRRVFVGSKPIELR